MAQLPTIKMDGKRWFIDRRLGEIRNVSNPHDVESVSQEIIDFWLENKVTDLDSLEVA